MLQEQGPLIIDGSGSLMENPYAWTKVANLLVVESPAGVGYSYCAAMVSGGACKNDDISTAKALYAGLVDFFGTKFPFLAKEAFFITGESYAGVYCPTLAAEIVAGNAKGATTRINLVGMAVGDPCTDNDSQRQSMDMLWYAHKNSLVPDKVRWRTISWHLCSLPQTRSLLAVTTWPAPPTPTPPTPTPPHTHTHTHNTYTYTHTYTPMPPMPPMLPSRMRRCAPAHAESPAASPSPPLRLGMHSPRRITTPARRITTSSPRSAAPATRRAGQQVRGRPRFRLPRRRPAPTPPSPAASSLRQGSCRPRVVVLGSPPPPAVARRAPTARRRCGAT